VNGILNNLRKLRSRNLDNLTWELPYSVSSSVEQAVVDKQPDNRQMAVQVEVERSKLVASVLDKAALMAPVR
jgi:hypothetical protein